MIELLGPLPLAFALSGKFSGDFFSRTGELKNIKEMKVWPLMSVLTEKYRFEPQVAAGASFVCLFFASDRRR